MLIPKLIATYSRVSTARQEEEQTVLTQTATLKEFAQKNHLNIIEEYIDEGWSGDILARPALDKLRQDAKQKRWQAVLIYDPDRLARRYSYQELIMDELREAGIEIIFVTISAPKNPEDKILHGVRGLFAEYERMKITERFRLGKLRKVKEGNILTTEPLYGYHYIPKVDKTHGYYTINESEASVVRMIFTWVADEGLTQRKIIQRLMEKGIRPRKSKRGVWSSSTLTTLLRHKGYIGEAHWGMSYAVIPQHPHKAGGYRKNKKTSRRTRPEEDWIKIPIPAIIDTALFHRARAQIARNFALCQRNRKNEYLLAGKIYCVCGRRRAGEGPQQGKHLYYRCNDRVSCFPLPPSCREKAVNARIADEVVWDHLCALMTSPKLLLAQAKRSREQDQKEPVSFLDEKAAGAELKGLEAQEDRYNKAYGAGVFSVEQLAEYLTPLREKMTSLKVRLAESAGRRSEAIESPLPARHSIERFCTKSVMALKNLNFTVRRAIIAEVVEKVVGTKDQLSVEGCIPLHINVNFNSEHRHGTSTISNAPALENEDKINFSFDLPIPTYQDFYPIHQRARNRRGRFVKISRTLL